MRFFQTMTFDSYYSDFPFVNSLNKKNIITAKINTVIIWVLE